MKRPAKQFALCLESAENEASLILGEVYRILSDARAAKDDLVRIVDESGDDRACLRRRPFRGFGLSISRVPRSCSGDALGTSTTPCIAQSANAAPHLRHKERVWA